MEKQSVDRIVRKKELRQILSIGQTKLDEMVRSGEFPAPVRLGGPRSRAIGWRLSDVQRWIDERPPAIPAEKAA